MRKYVILVAAILMMLFLGANYAWSTFVPALKSKFGFTTAQTQAIFGTVPLIFTIFTIVGGRLQDRIGPCIPAFAGGVIFGASYILAGCSSGTYPELQIFIGITGGIGAGLCYLCPIVCSVKWFPNHQSLVTGIVAAAYPGSAIIISQVGEYLLTRQIDVLIIFRYMGFFFLTVIPITSLILHNPPLAQTLATDRPIVKASVLFKNRCFWGLFCAIFAASSIGLLIIGNIKPFGLSLHLDMVAAGAAVSIISLSNAVGRIIWGITGNLIEGKNVILFSLISSVIVCLATPFFVRDILSFQLFSIIAGFNYASCNVLYAAEIARTCGPEKMGTIYSTVLVGNGIAGLTAPPLAGRIFDSAGTYTPAFLIIGLLSIIGIILFYFLYQPVRMRDL